MRPKPGRLLVLCFLFIGFTSCMPNSIVKNSSSTTSESISAPSGSDTPTAPVVDSTSPSPLTVDPMSLQLYPGETKKLAIRGGKKPYTLSDSGAGFLNKLTYWYYAPSTSSAFSETISVVDDQNSYVNVSVKIKSFEPPYSARGNVSHSFVNFAPSDYVILNATTHFVLSSSSTLSSDSNNAESILFRSTDAGLTFTPIYSAKGTQTLLKAFKNSVGNLFLLHRTQGSGVTYGFKLLRSTDLGATWTETAINTPLNSVARIFVGNLSDTLYVSGHITSVFGDDSPQIYKSSNLGASWELVSSLDFSSYDSGINLSIANILELPSNVLIFTATLYSDNLPVSWRTYRSTDLGANWTLVDNYNLSSTKNRYATGMVRLSNGTLIALGAAINASNIYYSTIRKSTDQGITWTLGESYIYASGKSCFQGNIFLASNNHVMYKSLCYDSSNALHIIGRISTDATTWAPETDTINSGYSISPGPYAEDPSGNIFSLDSLRTLISGIITYTTLNIRKKPFGSSYSNYSSLAYSTKTLIPQRGTWDSSGMTFITGSGSTNTYGQNAWKTILFPNENTSAITYSDTFIYPGSSKSADGRGLLVLPDGDLLVVGNAIDNSNYSHAIVRKGAKTGVGAYTWTTADDFHATGTSQDYAYTALKADSGHIVTFGRSQSGAFRSYVRRAAADLTGATTVDTFQYAPSNDTLFMSAAKDNLGRLYSLSYSPSYYISPTDNGYKSHLRISDDNGLTWSTIRNWNTYLGQSIYVGSDDKIVIAGILNGSKLFLETCTDRGTSWSSLINGQTFTSAAISSVNIHEGKIFVFGNFVSPQGYSTVLRYDTATNSLLAVDSRPTREIISALNSFTCQNGSWCVLNSIDGSLLREVTASIRRMLP
jgi:hypothetical protein